MAPRIRVPHLQTNPKLAFSPKTAIMIFTSLVILIGVLLVVFFVVLQKSSSSASSSLTSRNTLPDDIILFPEDSEGV